MARRKTTKKATPRARSTFNFKSMIKKDNVLLLELLESPIKALRNRDIICDQKMINNFNKVRDNIIERAKAAFIESGFVKDSTMGCMGCQGCQGCQGCN